MIAGTAYFCVACRNRDGGDFVFMVSFTDSEEPAEATRCPRCGSIEEIHEIESLTVGT